MTRPRPAELALQARREWIPRIRHEFAGRWKTWSYCFQEAIPQASQMLSPVAQGSRINVSVFHGDPVNYALHWRKSSQTRVALICVANPQKAGGDWETAGKSYEGELCRRSTLSATLTTPGPGSPTPQAYPMKLDAGMWSESVVVFRSSEKDRYEMWPEDQWQDLSVCSKPPVRRPKVNVNTGQPIYSFSQERELMRDAMRGALAICAANGVGNIVIGNFGLGEVHLNPPREMMAMWHELLNYDPLFYGHVRNVAFVFDNAALSTEKAIVEDLTKSFKHTQPPPEVVAAKGQQFVPDYELFRQGFQQAQQ